MSLAELRDLVIVIFAILAIIATIGFMFLSVILFRKLSPLLDSAKRTVNNVQGTTSFVSDTMVKPVIWAMSFASGVRRGVAMLSGVTKRTKGGKGG